MILVHYKDCYIDEFEISGMALLSEERWEQIVNDIPEQEYEFWFGTNSYIVYPDKNSFLSKFWSRPISERDSKIIKKTIKGIKTGVGFWPIEILEEEIDSKSLS